MLQGVAQDDATSPPVPPPAYIDATADEVGSDTSDEEAVVAFDALPALVCKVAELSAGIDDDSEDEVVEDRCVQQRAYFVDVFE